MTEGNDRAVCASCCGEKDVEPCPHCDGAGVVRGELPAEGGWYHAQYGDGSIGLLEVTAQLDVLGIDSKGGSVHVSQANWHDELNEPIVAWGPRVMLTWEGLPSHTHTEPPPPPMSASSAFSVSLPRIHPREQIVCQADLDLSRAVLDWRQEHDELTYGEELKVLVHVFNDTLSGIAKHTIREERHPGKPNKPGGLT